MQIKKFVATGLAAVMAGATLAGAALAATQLGNVLNTIGQQAVSGTPYLVVVGSKAAPSDVVGAIDVAAALAQQMYTKEQVPGVTVSKLTGGVALDTADTKLYLGDQINKARKMLTSNDLPTLLASSSIEDDSGKTYDYQEYVKIGGKQIKYAQPDPSSDLKDPTYLIKLGTNPSTTDYLIEAWVSFNKPFNASKAVGKELKLFGKSFTISAETDSSQLVLFGTAGKETVNAGETKTITVGGVDHTVKVIGISDASTAVLEVDGITKEVKEGNTYDFGGTSVYVSDVYFYEVPEKTGSVVVSIGADRYVLQDGQAIQHGTKGNEESIDGTYVHFDGNPQNLNGIYIAFDAYSATPAVDYIKAGTSWTDPVFGIKVAYNGPTSDISTETISVSPGGNSYYTLSFTDKYSKSGTIQWAYYSSGSVALADSTGKTIHVVEGESAQLNEYVFVSGGDFPHLLKVTKLDVPSSGTAKATLRDVFSGTEYSVEGTVSGSPATVTTTLVIDGQQYDVTLTDDSPDTIKIKRHGASDTVVFPTLVSKYGAKIAFTKPLTDISVSNGTKIMLPTGEVQLIYNTTHYEVLSGSNVLVDFTNLGTAKNATLNHVQYEFNVKSSDKFDVRISKASSPALVLIEEARHGDTNGYAIILPVSYDSSDERLELGTPVFTDGTSGVSTSSDKVTHYVDKWGTKVVYDVTGAGTATITYPDEQVYHQVAIGENPSWTTTTAGGETYNKIVPLTTTVAKLDTEVTDADKTNDNLVLVGGPCVNSLVADLANAGKFPYTCDSWPARNFGLIKAIDDAFASGKLALVVAGTRAEDTRLATSVLALGKLAGQTASSVEVTGTTASPVITPTTSSS